MKTLEDILRDIEFNTDTVVRYQQEDAIKFIIEDLKNINTFVKSYNKQTIYITIVESVCQLINYLLDELKEKECTDTEK